MAPATQYTTYFQFHNDNQKMSCNHNFHFLQAVGNLAEHSAGLPAPREFWQMIREFKNSSPSSEVEQSQGSCCYLPPPSQKLILRDFLSTSLGTSEIEY